MDYVLPELGEGIYEAELVEWRVRPGDAITRGQTLAEVLTDKATMELPAPFQGTITELRVEPDGRMKVGQTILTYDASTPTKGNGKDVPRAETPLVKAAPVKAAPVKAAPVKAAPVKAAPVKESPLRPADATAAPARARIASEMHSTGEDVSGSARVKAGPAVRRMASLMGVDLTQVHGSGPAGRILIDDLSAASDNESAGQRNLPEQDVASRQESVHSGPSKHFPHRGVLLKPGTRIKFKGIRRKIAEHMVESKSTIPHFGYVDECDVSDLVRLKASLSQTVTGVKLTYLPWIVKAVVAALAEVPLVNASLDEEAEEIVLHSRYDIGIATAAPDGLVVPVVHDADRKSLIELAREIQSLAYAARTGTLAANQLRGGTFTVSSIGSIGGLTSTPIILKPQVGILGIGRITKRPIYDPDGNLRPADMVYLSFSFDHRVVDGSVGAEFANAMIHQLQNPGRMLLEH